MMKLKAAYLFGKTPLPEDIGDEITRDVELLRKCRTKEQYLKQAYILITTRYESGRISTILRIHELFSSGIQDLWHRRGFMHCTNQNYLLALLLVKGDYFEESDIQPRGTLLTNI